MLFNRPPKASNNIYSALGDTNNEIFNKRNRLMWANEWISKSRHYNIVYAFFALIMFFVIVAILYLIEDIPTLVNPEAVSSLTVLEIIAKHPFIVLSGMGFVLLGYLGFVYKIKVSYAPLNVGQRGTQRWTTRAEIEKQYKAIPERLERFPGGGGVPIARTQRKIYIDDSPVNNLIIGITRSGKGELVVFPEIDIYSRAEKQASMIITDPKLELAPASMPRLIELGYECHVLNLIDPDYSMGYNPLACCLDEYKKGNEDDAKLLCGAFCFSIFNPDQATGDNKFFEDNSTTLLTALILAAIEDNIGADKKLNTKRKNKHEKEEARKKEIAINKLPKKDKEIFILQEKIREERKINPEINEFALCEELKISINTLRKIQSCEEVVIDYVRKEYEEIHPNEKNVNMYSIINTFSVLASKRLSQTETMLDRYFTNRPEGNTARLLYASTGIAGDKTKGSIYSNMLTALKVFNYDNIARMTAESTLDMKRIGFGTKPIAIFIGMPDYDKSNYFLATAFIRQLYFTLAKMAEHAPGQRCSREVIFLLDEFGNIPPIENLATIITICLGRNIRFNLIIQSFAQVHKLYGEDANTIIGNCGNHIYIQTSDEETAEKFSGQLGSETITSVNRTGKIFSLNKERTEMSEERRLLDKNELMRLMPGETIVNRVMKRQDLERQGVIPYPICNMNEHKMKHRFEYLIEDYPSGNILYNSALTREVFKMLREQQEDMVASMGKNAQDIIDLIGEPNPIDVELETTLAIDLSQHLWSAEDYAKLYLPVNEFLNQMGLYKLYSLIDFAANTRQNIEDGKITAIQIIPEINKMFNNNDPQIREKGYLADDLFYRDVYGDSISSDIDEIWDSIKLITFDELTPLLFISRDSIYPKKTQPNRNRRRM